MVGNVSSRRTLVMLMTIAVLAAVSYGAAATVSGRPVVIADAFNYNKTAMRLLNTGVFEYGAGDISSTTGPTAYTMPGYTLLLATVYRFLPHSGDAIANMLRAQLPIILVQLLLAVGSAVLICFAGLRLDGAAAGWVSGALAIAYLPFGFNATVSLTETLSLFLMCGVMVVVIELIREQATRSRALGVMAGVMGALGGLSTLVRPTIAAWLLVPAVAWLWINRKSVRQAWMPVAIAAACFSLVMFPWVARNYVALGAFIPLNATASTPLLDSVGGSKFTAAEEELKVRATAAGKDPIRAVALSRLGARWAAGPWKFVEWKANTLWAGVSNITDLPGDIAIHIRSYGRPPENSYADPSGSLRVVDRSAHETLVESLTWYHQMILLLAGVGLALGRRRMVVWVLASIPLYFAVVHTIILFMVRYFYPAMPALFVLAALGICGLVRTVASAWHSKPLPSFK